MFLNERFLSECLYFTDNLKTSQSSAAYPPSSPLSFPSLHQNWKKVGGRVLSAGFLPPQRLPVDTQTHKHLPLLVPPLS